MYNYINMYIYIYICICIYVYMYMYIYVRLSVYCMHWRSEHVKRILGIIGHMLTKHIHKLNIVKHYFDSKTGNNTAHCTVWRKSVVLRHHGRTNGQEIKKWKAKGERMSAKTRFETPFSFWKLKCCAGMCFAKICKWPLDAQLHTGQLTTEIFRTSPGGKGHVAMFPWLNISCFFFWILAHLSGWKTTALGLQSVTPKVAV